MWNAEHLNSRGDGWVVGEGGGTGEGEWWMVFGECLVSGQWWVVTGEQEAWWGGSDGEGGAKDGR